MLRSLASWSLAFALAACVPRAALAADTAIVLSDAEYVVTQPYEYDANDPYAAGWHRGVDVVAARDAVRSVTDGRVAFVGDVFGRRVITVRSTHGTVPIIVTYTGLGSTRVRVGDAVRAHDAIGRGRALHIGAYVAADHDRYLPISMQMASTIVGHGGSSVSPVQSASAPVPSPVTRAVLRRLRAAIDGTAQLGSVGTFLAQRGQPADGGGAWTSLQPRGRTPNPRPGHSMHVGARRSSGVEPGWDASRGERLRRVPSRRARAVPAPDDQDASAQRTAAAVGVAAIGSSIAAGRAATPTSIQGEPPERASRSRMVGSSRSNAASHGVGVVVDHRDGAAVRAAPMRARPTPTGEHVAYGRSPSQSMTAEEVGAAAVIADRATAAHIEPERRSLLRTYLIAGGVVLMCAGLMLTRRSRRHREVEAVRIVRPWHVRIARLPAARSLRRRSPRASVSQRVGFPHTPGSPPSPARPRVREPA